jgi:hypothetical protein
VGTAFGSSLLISSEKDLRHAVHPVLLGIAPGCPAVCFAVFRLVRTNETPKRLREGAEVNGVAMTSNGHLYASVHNYSSHGPFAALFVLRKREQDRAI